ncbi:thiamine pyrophosphate-dependent enzyme [Streptomyces sp. NBC_01283]|uniref:thiamine pyrophosphate-dependent enzyme n=1 Tax=Streptomyces sp. NBC_01283 TaxID=2903812 RepID=UPI00352F2134
MHIADLSRGMLGANGIGGVAFFGDGGSRQGTPIESLDLATVWRLPAVFVAPAATGPMRTSPACGASRRRGRGASSVRT